MVNGPFINQIFTLQKLKHKFQTGVINKRYTYFAAFLVITFAFSGFLRSMVTETTTGIKIYVFLSELTGFGLILFMAYLGFNHVQKTFSWHAFFQIFFALHWRMLVLQIALVTPSFLIALPTGSFDPIRHDRLSAGMLSAEAALLALFATILPLVIIYVYQNGKLL